MAKHQAPDRHPVRDRAAIRTTALAMIGLTLFVIAMIASYSGAFAKPTLHHMAVAVAGPQQVVDGIRGQESLAVTKVDDDAAARKQVYERKSDAAFVVAPTGEMKIYVAGGGGRSVANAAETVGRTIAAKAGLTPTVEDVAPASAGDPSGTVEFYAVIFISIGASVGAAVFGRLMGTVRKPLTLALRTATLAGYSALLAAGGDPLRRRGSWCPDRSHLAAVRCDVALRDGRRRSDHRCGGGVRLGRLDGPDGVSGRDRQRRGRWSGGPAAAVGILFDVHRDRAAGFGRLAAAQRLLLRWSRGADTACHAGDLGRGRLFARNRRHRFATELSCCP